MDDVSRRGRTPGCVYRRSCTGRSQVRRRTIGRSAVSGPVTSPTREPVDHYRVQRQSMLVATYKRRIEPVWYTVPRSHRRRTRAVGTVPERCTFTNRRSPPTSRLNPSLPRPRTPLLECCSHATALISFCLVVQMAPLLTDSSAGRYHIQDMAGGCRS